MPGHEIELVDRVHRRVVALEMRQINPCEYDTVEAVADAGQLTLQVLDNPPRLRLEAVRQRCGSSFGSVGTWPVTKSQRSDVTTWLNGATGVERFNSIGGGGRESGV